MQVRQAFASSSGRLASRAVSDRPAVPRRRRHTRDISGTTPRVQTGPASRSRVPAVAASFVAENVLDPGVDALQFGAVHRRGAVIDRERPLKRVIRMQIVDCRLRNPHHFDTAPSLRLLIVPAASSCRRARLDFSGTPTGAERWICRNCDTRFARNQIEPKVDDGGFFFLCPVSDYQNRIANICRGAGGHLPNVQCDDLFCFAGSAEIRQHRV